MTVAAPRVIRASDVELEEVNWPLWIRTRLTPVRGSPLIASGELRLADTSRVGDAVLLHSAHARGTDRHLSRKPISTRRTIAVHASAVERNRKLEWPWNVSSRGR